MIKTGVMIVLMILLFTTQKYNTGTSLYFTTRKHVQYLLPMQSWLSLFCDPCVKKGSSFLEA